MIYIPIIIAITVILIAIVEYNSIMSKRKIEQDYYELNYEYASKGLDAKTSAEAKKCLDVLEANYPGDSAIQSRISREVYHDDMRDLRNYVNELKEEEKSEWKDRADWALSSFFDYYSRVTQYTLDNLDKIKNNQERCLYWWDRYFEVPAPEHYISAQDYLKKQKEYDPMVMRDRLSVSDKLSSCVSESQSLLEKRKAIARHLRREIRRNGEIARSELLSIPFDSYSSNEIEQVYDWMKRKKQLIEVKKGNRYFVTIPIKK